MMAIGPATTGAWKAADVLAKIGVAIALLGGTGLAIAFVLLAADVAVPVRRALAGFSLFALTWIFPLGVVFIGFLVIHGLVRLLRSLF